MVNPVNKSAHRRLTSNALHLQPYANPQNAGNKPLHYIHSDYATPIPNSDGWAGGAVSHAATRPNFAGVRRHAEKVDTLTHRGSTCASRISNGPPAAAVVWICGNRAVGSVGADMLDYPAPRIGRRRAGNRRPDRQKRALRRSDQESWNSSVQRSRVRKALSSCGRLAVRSAYLGRASELVQDTPITALMARVEENRVVFQHKQIVRNRFQAV